MTRLFVSLSRSNPHAVSYCKFIAIIFFSIFIASPCMAQPTPVGHWATIDDVTGRQKSIIDIYTVGDTVEGKIVKTFYYPGEIHKTVCDQCKGDDYMKPIIGMVILRGMHEDSEGKWSGGMIMDPHIGKTYRCIMVVADDGKTMKVHGYIGLPLLGRTQIWHRLSSK